jgi:hypothetical protein
MAYPTTEQWIEFALGGELVVDIGQIDKTTQRALNKLVREGKLARCRGFWCSLLIGPLKTIWCAPHAKWACGQLDQVLEATEAFWEQARAQEQIAEAA